MSGRYLIYVPEINPDTFVLFFQRGNNPKSFSIRDYTTGPPPITLRAKDFPDHYTADLILKWAGHNAEPADAIHTEKFTYWQGRILRLNASRIPPGRRMERKAEPEYPLLDSGAFELLPKARKPKDVQRMLTSARSEDWVTWTVLRLLARRPATVWWPRLLWLAGRQAPTIPELDPPTSIVPWELVSSPPDYESASRARMASSDNPAWIDRSTISKAVEGDSEIDIVLRGTGYRVFVEAKLTSDISTRTTYDPARNQIVRNIDCLLEATGVTELPLFWIFAKDGAPSRMYVQLMELWREDPEPLTRALPHRDVDALRGVLDRYALITWADILKVIQPEKDDELAIWSELVRRIEA